MPHNSSRPKIGVALSGGAARSLAHFAILDVLIEHGIKPDIIVGCSSGAIAAIAYGAGTRDFAYEYFCTMNRKRMWRSLSMRGARGGLLHMDKGHSDFMQLTRGLKFEDLPIKVGVTAADIETGELNTITKGDMIIGLKATMAVPGLFEPMVIDNKILLEGGLVNVVPAVSVRQMGADIVIGVDVAKAKFFFQKKLPLFRLIRRWRRLLGIGFVQDGIIKPLTSKISHTMEKQFGLKKRRVPNCFRIFFWAVDRSFDVEKQWDEENRACDIMISPPVKNTPKFAVNPGLFIYEQGRLAALDALPRIQKLIAEYESR